MGWRANIVKDVNVRRANFVINSGDVVWWGNQGRTVDDSPYCRHDAEAARAAG